MKFGLSFVTNIILFLEICTNVFHIQLYNHTFILQIHYKLNILIVGLRNIFILNLVKY